MRALQEYWEMFDKHPHLQGGFIWDWVDQGLINTAKAPSGLGPMPSPAHDTHATLCLLPRLPHPCFMRLKKFHLQYS